MITLPVITTVLMLWAVHTFADFVLQTHKQAINKSTSNYWLCQHTFTYSFVWLVVAYLMTRSFDGAIAFAAITCVAHTATDWITSRWSKKYFSKQDYHNGFVVVGIDQFLHLAQILLTYYYVINNF
jgi:uncharacterized membrane protein YhdT